MLCDLFQELQDDGRLPPLDDWACRSGVSKGYISRVVRGECEPTFFIALCLIRCLRVEDRGRAAALLTGDTVMTIVGER